MDNQRIVRRTAFSGEDTLHRLSVAGIRPQPVYRFRGKRHELALAEKLRRLLNRIRLRRTIRRDLPIRRHHIRSFLILD
ncbi:hypothetical protein D3C87_1919120 [compost metagenome]